MLNMGEATLSNIFYKTLFLPWPLPHLGKWVSATYILNPKPINVSQLNVKL